ncbi:MAG: SDR family oxidoreductase [Actinophytocola sp.]|nr:SDR family oxidoreductase [Actinophytocola sp.]
MLLDDKVVLVSGAGPGLGRAIAIRSALAGADVVLAARNEQRLADVAAEVTAIGRKALPVPADVTDPAGLAGITDAALSTFGRVDALVHNVFARPRQVELLDADADAIRSEFDTGVLAALDLTRRLAPALVEARGAVVVINSMVIRNRLPLFGAYRMVKQSLLALARGLSIELGPLGVRVNSVAPGYIWDGPVKDRFARIADERGVDPQQVYAEVAAETDLRRLPEPDEIADAVVFFASNLARAITGQCLDVTAGQTHH